MYDYLVTHHVIDAVALVGFVLGVAALSEYLASNGRSGDRIVALAGGIPVLPLLPRETMLGLPAPVATWVVAAALGFLAVTLCRFVLVAQLEQLLDEFARRRDLPASTSGPLGEQEWLRSIAGPFDVDYLCQPVDESSLVFGRPGTRPGPRTGTPAGDPLATSRENGRDVA